MVIMQTFADECVRNLFYLLDLTDYFENFYQT